MGGYGQFCAVARSLDVLGERWTLLIVRELLLGSSTFSQIRSGLPRIPKATLADRLRTLQRAGLVTKDDGGYRLTRVGLALAPVLRELARWAVDNRAVPLHAGDLDPVALTWDIQRRIVREALPDRLVVVAITFTDAPASAARYWLHLSPTDVNLCREDTGAAVDLWLIGPTEAVTRWWLGELSWQQLVRRPGVSVDGDRTLQRQMRHWFARYVFTPERLATTAQ